MNFNRGNLYYIFFGILICILSCSEKKTQSNLFELLDNQQTGLIFSNDLINSQEFNVYKYRNFYNGGGVAIGDVNNDNLLDIYLTANQDSNRLFINKGNFKFEDQSLSSGTYGGKAWSTGVTMVDINGDSRMDIYVCNSGDLKGDDKENELFINNGDGSFTESAEIYNLNDPGYSTHAAFFDYDKDGDLDAYILNNSYQAIGSFNLKKNERPIRDALGGDKLMENVKGKFVDVSDRAGIYGSVIGFGLGVTVGDVNNDNWEDIFVSNDFFERDYLYINQQNGTFKEDLTNQMMSISGASMGADIADIDNDGYGDIFVTEMLPYQYERLKTVTTFESWDKYNYNVQNGYHHQFTRNVLHHNNGNGSFSEISRFSGVHASDWSWGALFFDMDNDGYKDLFVANGIYRDLTNQDYLQYVANEEVVKSVLQSDGVNYKALIDTIPSNKVANCSFKNSADLKFKEYNDSGLNIESFSNGAAYGDLDNDGDLDLVVNNVNMPAFLFKNNATSNNYLEVKLKGESPNTGAIGSKIIVQSGNERFQLEIQPSRGFQSSVSPYALFGLGSLERVSVKVIWPSGKITQLDDVDVNQSLTIEEQQGEDETDDHIVQERIFYPSTMDISFLQKENAYIDFNRERLLFHMRSTEGPIVDIGDLDFDGQMDLVIPGSKGSISKVFYSDNGSFKEEHVLSDIDRLLDSEHVEAMIFDANNDGLKDIYLASGGVEVSPFSASLNDHLFINKGNRSFERSEETFPNTSDKVSTGAVVNFDMDEDGDMDLFIGERVKIGAYGLPGSGYILENDGSGKFRDITDRVAPGLKDIGMITDASSCDLNNDGLMDILFVGEYLPIVALLNSSGGFKILEDPSLQLYGWWNSVKTVDFDKDGDIDIIAGNHGTNSRFKASSENPIRLYVSDFDNNGFTESIMTFKADDGKYYPYALRHNLVEQIKELKKKFPNFASFRNASIDQIFTKEQLGKALILEANHLESVVLINNGDLTFSKLRLPLEAQFSPIYAIESSDIDKDGDMDILMGGNLYKTQPEVGIYDATQGLYIENDEGELIFENGSKGFQLKGEIRDIKLFHDQLIVVRNQDSLSTFQIKTK